MGLHGLLQDSVTFFKGYTDQQAYYNRMFSMGVKHGLIVLEKDMNYK
jgi:hypothetical protein